MVVISKVGDTRSHLKLKHTHFIGVGEPLWQSSRFLVNIGEFGELTLTITGHVWQGFAECGKSTLTITDYELQGYAEFGESTLTINET